MLKSYVCERFPGLAIRNAGRRAEFRDGYFESEDPAIQTLVESNDYYGIHIHERDTVEARAVADAKAMVPGPGEPEQTFGGVESAPDVAVEAPSGKKGKSK